MMPVWAAEAMLKKEGKLPVNLKFLFDGDEERGSLYLKQFAQSNKALLKTDLAYNAVCILSVR
jgi:acetylornithine deacetylase/succinyl-diaminopimelate desuccinylase-like protein